MNKYFILFSVIFSYTLTAMDTNLCEYKPKGMIITADKPIDFFNSDLSLLTSEQWIKFRDQGINKFLEDIARNKALELGMIDSNDRDNNTLFLTIRSKNNAVNEYQSKSVISNLDQLTSEQWIALRDQRINKFFEDFGRNKARELGITSSNDNIYLTDNTIDKKATIQLYIKPTNTPPVSVFNLDHLNKQYGIKNPATDPRLNKLNK